MESKLTKDLALNEFFQQKVKEATKLQNIKISGEVEFYLVHILTHYSVSENFFHSDENGKLVQRPLALKLYDAVFSNKPNAKFHHLKSLGDTALYHAGVFYEGLYNQIVDVDYYILMGGSAYQSLANLSTQHGRTLADMYNELSLQFAKLVEVLHLCCEKEVANTDLDLLLLLDRYIKTGSQKAKQILEEKGILPESILGDKTIQ